MLTKNRFQIRENYNFDPETESIVFISYRRVICDKLMARRSAGVLERTPRIKYWLDEDDKCMAHAQSQISDIATANCIEQGLDVASALLGIIGPETFDSPWIPYEIGGARGRQRFFKPFSSSSSASSPPLQHPLIAHLIHDINIEEAPDFVALGIPLVSLDEVEKWAMSVAGILQEVQNMPIGKIRLTEARNIQTRYGIQEIYGKNTRHLGYL